jgi:hypothetical protein
MSRHHTPETWLLAGDEWSGAVRSEREYAAMLVLAAIAVALVYSAVG